MGGKAALNVLKTGLKTGATAIGTRLAATNTGQQIGTVAKAIKPAVILSAKVGLGTGTFAATKGAYESTKLYIEGTDPLSANVKKAQLSEMIKEGLLQTKDITVAQFKTHILDRHAKNMQADDTGVDKMAAKIPGLAAGLNAIANSTDSSHVHGAIKAISSVYDVGSTGIPLMASNTASGVTKALVEPVLTVAGHKLVDFMKEKSKSASVSSNISAAVKTNERQI